MTLFYKHFLKAGGLLAALLVTLFTPGLGRADVFAGYDIFRSSTLSNEAGVPFQGVPIGNFDFGGSIGVQNVGNADTIIQRNDAVTTDPGTTGLTVKDLQLITTQPLDLAGMFGLTSATGYYYATLDPNMVSGGSMMITGANGSSGTFSSNLTLYLDFSVCTSTSANSCGSTVFFEKVWLTQNGTWGRVPDPLYPLPYSNASTLTGVDYLLNGTDTTNDFWPSYILESGYAIAYSDHGFSNQISGQLPVLHTTIPEPSTFVLFSAGLALFGYSRRKTIRSKLSAA